MDSLTLHPLFITLSLFSLLFHTGTSEADNVKRSLINFLIKLSPSNPKITQQLGWSAASDPCKDGKWQGVSCTTRTGSVRVIQLRGLQLGGTIDAGLLCRTSSLALLTLVDCGIRGQLPTDIANCTQLTHLDVSGNRLSGGLPSSLADLINLKRLDISKNNFSGELPTDLSGISGMVAFLAQENRLDGPVPPLRFNNLNRFNVSANNLTGPIPPGGDLFTTASYSGNPGLCGKPLSLQCLPTPAPPKKSNPLTSRPAFTYSGYILLGAVIILYFLYRLCIRENKNNNQPTYSSSIKPVSTTTTTLTTSSSVVPSESIIVSSPLIVLKSEVRDLVFEDLLQAPAELVGRGKYGSVYKVVFDDRGTTLAVKRIKDGSISAERFKMRMELIDQARHPNVLPVMAFYSSKQEKLVIYEFQKNGSLFKILHGKKDRQPLDTNIRLRIAASISNSLAFMHRELGQHDIGHGSLKSSNILIDNNMDVCISEYGLTMYTNEKQYQIKADVYNFGVLLLELLTRKQVEDDGQQLVKWVQGIVREEWTMEVFDKELMFDDEGQDMIVRLLGLALKCMNENADARPAMELVAEEISSMKEVEEMQPVSEYSLTQ